MHTRSLVKIQKKKNPPKFLFTKIHVDFTLIPPVYQEPFFTASKDRIYSGNAASGYKRKLGITKQRVARRARTKREGRGEVRRKRRNVDGTPRGAQTDTRE